MTVAADIRTFLVEELLPGNDLSGLRDDDDLLGAELIDSLGIGELVSFMEERYGITIDDMDLTPKNFSSISSIAAFVEARTNGSAD